MSSLLKMFCGCCNTEDDVDAGTDQSRLVRDDENYSTTSGYQSAPTDASVVGRDNVASAAMKSHMTAAEEEQAILHRILLDTQAAVIDVGSMDAHQSNAMHAASGAMTAGHKEFTERMQKYDLAMKRADPHKMKRLIEAVAASSAHRTRVPSQSTPSSPPGTPPQTSTYGSMDDIGTHVADVLSVQPISSNLLDFAYARQRAMREAMTSTMRVQHQEALVVHMS